VSLPKAHDAYAEYQADIRTETLPITSQAHRDSLLPNRYLPAPLS